MSTTEIAQLIADNEARGAAKHSSNAADFKAQLIESRKRMRGSQGNAIAIEKPTSRTTEKKYRKMILPDVVKRCKPGLVSVPHLQ